jgi:circadian clock protein KaiC
MTTGVTGLDVVTNGGLEPGSVTVLAGAPGVGKTILAQQICFANATPEHRAAYYTTLSEPHSKLTRHLSQFDFFTPDALESRIEYLHLGDLVRSDHSNRMKALVDEITRKTLSEDPSLVVIDSAKALRDFASERDLRMAFYDLTSRLAHTDAALLLLGEYTPDEMAAGVEFSLADSIIHLAYEPREPIDRRWLRIVKMRGSHHLEGKHTFRISAGGFEVFPRTETLEGGTTAPTMAGRISSGVPGLDVLMGGGIGTGEATAILGPSGVGKTISSLRFVTEGITEGERCLYVTFQDTPDQLVRVAGNFGWDLETALRSGQLVVQHIPLGDIDLDMLTDRIRSHLVDGSIHRVVIDSLAEMVFACRESQRFPAFTRSLIGLVRSTGASLVITSETTTFGPSPEPLGGVTFLFHNLILMRYIEMDSATGRAVSIVKMRNSDHSKDVFQFTIDTHGPAVGPVLETVTGVLGWSVLRMTTEL